MAGLQRRLYTFFARDNALRYSGNNCVFAIPNFKSLGPKVNV